MEIEVRSARSTHGSQDRCMQSHDDDDTVKKESTWKTKT